VAPASLEENWKKMRGNDLYVKAFMPLYHKMHRTAENRGITGEGVRAAATDGVNGVNGFQVNEGAPSLASKLHMST
jgi:hypothetical protein